MEIEKFKQSVQRVGANAGELILQAVDKAIQARWEPAGERAARATGVTNAEKISEVRKAFCTELGIAGAAAGGVAAVPGVGTGASLATAAGDITWTTVRLTDLILTIARIHGHDSDDIAERRLWVLAVLGGSANATKIAEKLAAEMGKGLGKKAVAAIPRTAISRLNAAMGRTIVTKYGTKRGAVQLGKALPFGIGAIVGGGINYGTVRAVTRTANKFFSLLPGPEPDFAQGTR
jgi:hypothetical protein